MALIAERGALAHEQVHVVGAVRVVAREAFAVLCRGMLGPGLLIDDRIVAVVAEGGHLALEQVLLIGFVCVVAGHAFAFFGRGVLVPGGLEEVIVTREADFEHGPLQPLRELRLMTVVTSPFGEGGVDDRLGGIRLRYGW